MKAGLAPKPRVHVTALRIFLGAVVAIAIFYLLLQLFSEHQRERYSFHYWLPLILIAAAACALVVLCNTGRRENSLRHSPMFLQSLIDHLPVLVFATKLTGADRGRICVWNRTAELVTGYNAADVLGNSPNQVFPDAMARMHQENDSCMLADPMVMENPEVQFIRPDGETGTLHVISVPLFDADDRPEYLLGIAEDITRSRRQALALRTKQAELTAAYDASPLGLFRTDPHGYCTYVNRTWEKISGLSAEQALGNGWIRAIHPQDRIIVFRTWRQSASLDAESLSSRTCQATYRFVHADGQIIWVSAKTAPILVDGRIQGYTGTVDDVTARMESESALADSERRLRTVADTLPALVAYVDSDQRFRFNNLAWEEKYGGTRAALKGRSLAEFFGVRAYAEIAPYVARVLQGEKLSFEQEEETQQGYICMESTYIPQLGETGKTVIGFHMMLQDISARKLEQYHLRQLAQIDSLTGLLNRDGFNKKLELALDSSREAQSLLAVMFLDLDHFKSVNDTHGHHAGDLLLKAFAGRLSQALRSTDTIARLGGDEFTVVMEALSRPEDAELIATKIVQLVQTPFVLEGINITVGVSLGLAFCQSGSCSGEAVLQKADEMLYCAKHAGRNIYRAAPMEKIGG